MLHLPKQFNQIDNDDDDDDDEGEKNGEVFLSYRCHSLGDIINYKKHPGNIVEVASLGAQTLPPTYYPLKEAFPQNIIQHGKLSDLQLEGILHACQRHQIILSDGSRAGFYLADGAGVGKGRQVAGIIINNYVRGRRKHLWFSASRDLRLDAERDLKDLNCYIRVIDGCQQLDRETRVGRISADVEDGILFNTYATLIASGQRSSTSTRGSRMQQILDWCGNDDFDGCLIFDECHKAKQFIPGNEAASTKTANAAIDLQRKLPKARVVYCSATGVTDVKNMAFMERLGLWGEKTAFEDVNNFIQAMTTHGLGASEMLAMEMKAAGMYVSRSLSFESAEFHTVEINLTQQQIGIYNLCAKVWQRLADHIREAIKNTKTTPGHLWTMYWSCHQRFFKQLCMSFKVPAIVQEAKSALRQGYCVVIGLQTTGEASLESEITRQGKANGFISTAKEIIVRFITHHFPMEEKTSTGTAIHRSNQRVVDAFLHSIDSINLPNNPLDELIQQLGGTNCVAEMTGRRGRMVCVNGNSTPVYQLRATDSNDGVESLNNNEKNLFMQGKKLVAIISDAASTGISLHSDTRVANNRRRVHITMELPWSAEKAVQQLGRSHRSNQSSAPIYKLMTTNIGGEKRFVAGVAHRLLSLGALTRGDRRAATGADFSQFNYNTHYGRTALSSMYSHIQRGVLYPNVTFSNLLKQAGVVDENDYTINQFHKDMVQSLIDMRIINGAAWKAKGASDVHRFLNRILGLTIERQNLLFTYFCQCLTNIIKKAKREGKYDEGITDIKGRSVVMVDSPKEVFTQVKRGNISTQQITLSVDRGMDWPTVLKLYHDQAINPLDGFYCSETYGYRRKLYLFALYNTYSDSFNFVRPNTGFSPYIMNRQDLLQKYDKIGLSEAENGWKEEFNSMKAMCTSDGFGSSSTVGNRIIRVDILCGGIIPMLTLLKSMLANCAQKHRLTLKQQRLQIVRVQLDDGKRIVGLRYPKSIISEVITVLEWAVRMKRRSNPFKIPLQDLLDSVTDLPSIFRKDNNSVLCKTVLRIVSSTTKPTLVQERSVDQCILKCAFSEPLSTQNFFITYHTYNNNIHQIMDNQKLSSRHYIKKENSANDTDDKDDNKIRGIKYNQELNSRYNIKEESSAHDNDDNYGNNIHDIIDNQESSSRHNIKEESSAYDNHDEDDIMIISDSDNDDVIIISDKDIDDIKSDGDSDDIIIISDVANLSSSNRSNFSVCHNANEIQKPVNKRQNRDALQSLTTSKKYKHLTIFDDIESIEQDLSDDDYQLPSMESLLSIKHNKL